jgi:multidrug transporter EmrE-like cation transporter
MFKALLKFVGNSVGSIFLRRTESGDIEAKSLPMFIVASVVSFIFFSISVEDDIMVANAYTESLGALVAVCAPAGVAIFNGFLNRRRKK